jgi:alpha-beta hydrolase superfamily lysophospholipase
MAERFNVLAPDLPGFGRSPKPAHARWPAGPNIREQADQLLAWMNARGVREAILCGHSAGAQVAVDIASRFPDRVRQLVLLGPTGDPSIASIRQHLPRFLLAALFESPGLLAVLNVEYLSAGTARIAQHARRIVDDPVVTKLPNVLSPTLVVRGQYDPLVSEDWGRTICKRLPHAALVTVERAGHAIQFTAAAVTASVVERFIDGAIDTDDVLLRADTEIVPMDNPRRDPLGPPQPISPRVHGVMDHLLAAATLALPRALGWSRRTRNVWSAGAALATATNLVTDHPTAAVRKLPMVTHTAADLFTGAAVLTAAATYLRKSPKHERLATLGLGLFYIAAAALTAKPTGPARRMALARRASFTRKSGTLQETTSA